MEVGDSTYLGRTSAELADLVAADGEFDFTLLPLDQVRDLYEAGRWWELEWGRKSAPGVEKLHKQILDGEVDYFMYSREPPRDGVVGRPHACFFPYHVGGELVRCFQWVAGLDRAPRELLTLENMLGAVNWVRGDLREALVRKVFRDREMRMKYCRPEGWDGCSIILRSGRGLSELAELSKVGVEVVGVDLAGILNSFLNPHDPGSDEQLDRLGLDLLELAGLTGDPETSPLRLLPSMRVPKSWGECFWDGELVSDLLLATPELLAYLGERRVGRS